MYNDVLGHSIFFVAGTSVAVYFIFFFFYLSCISLFAVFHLFLIFIVWTTLILMLLRFPIRSGTSLALVIYSTLFYPV